MKQRSELWCRLRSAVRVVAWLAVAAGVFVLISPIVWKENPGSTSRATAVVGLGVLLMEVFAFHFGLVLLAVSPIAAMCRQKVSTALLFSIGVSLAGPGLMSFTRSTPALPSDGYFTVLSCNTLFMKADFDEIESIVAEELPDVIVFQEVWSERAEEVLQRFGSSYPHTTFIKPQRWGCMVLSRTPFSGEPSSIVGHPQWPIAQPAVIVEHEGGRVAVVGVHLPSPNRIDQSAAAASMAASVAEWLRIQHEDPKAPDAFVLTGDFNAPLWAGRLRALRDAGLVEAHAVAGTGRGATWPDLTPLRFAPGIRLDQAAFSGGLRCVGSRVLGSTGSDHRPIVTRFVWE